MMSDLFASTLLAATDETGLLQTILSQVVLWGRVAIGIGLVIFVHELGHFLAAKLFGVKVEKFYVGFDVPIKIGPVKFPRTLGKFTYGETEYGIGVVPLGGYVKMLGQDDDPRRAEEEAKRIRVAEGDQDSAPKLDPRSYPAKPVWQRMVIISAGVVMNVITGILFAAIAYGYGVTYNPAIIGGVTGGDPAWQAGIEPGGKVVSVGTLAPDENLHFREMRIEILTRGLENPDEPIDVAILYDDGLRNYQLTTAPHPESPDMRMIGIITPISTRLSKEAYAVPSSIASEVLTPADAGAQVVAFNGNRINDEAIVPGTPLFNHLYTHPDQPIELTLVRVDNSQHTVEVPPQPAKDFGVRFTVGPIVALVQDGPAEKAGLQVGDVIEAIDDDESLDAYGLAHALLGRDEAVTLRVRRGSGDSASTHEVTLEPSQMLQTLPPTESTRGCFAISAFGLAYDVDPVVASIAEVNAAADQRVTEPASENAEQDAPAEATSGDQVVNDAPALSAPSVDRDAPESLQEGDVLQKVKAIWPGGKIPASLQDERFQWLVQAFSEGWEFDSSTPAVALMQAVQLLPVGTELSVLATRPPEGRVIEATMRVSKSDRFWFERGLVFAPSESVQRAESVGEALALGYREGKRRLSDVFRFLKMLVRGRVEAKQVGGPIRIVQLAGSEAERGISPQLLFLTMLSMNLAILNFLPIPALDGGHMMFLLAEGIRGRRLDEQLEMRLTLAGVVALLLLMAFVLFNDLYQI